MDFIRSRQERDGCPRREAGFLILIPVARVSIGVRRYVWDWVGSIDTDSIRCDQLIRLIKVDNYPGSDSSAFIQRASHFQHVEPTNDLLGFAA